MFEEDTFDLGARNVDASTDDQIVVAALVMEVAIAVADVDVSGNIPSVSHVLSLPIGQIEVTATRRSANGEQSRLTIRDGCHGCLVDYHRFITRNNFARCTGSRMS